jgi:hypothetical protein
MFGYFIIMRLSAIQKRQLSFFYDFLIKLLIEFSGTGRIVKLFSQLYFTRFALLIVHESWCKLFKLLLYLLLFYGDLLLNLLIIKF